MATLEELTQQEGQPVTLEELGGGSVNRVEVDIAGTNRLFAARVATLSPEPERAEQVYDLVNSEMAEENSSQTADALLEMYKNTSRSEARSALVDFLADPTIPDEEKQAAATQLNDLKNEQYNINNILKAEALGADNDDLGHEENPEVEFVRGSRAEIIEQDNEWRRQQQALINREAAKAADSSTAEKFGEIFEYFVPFMESKDAADIASQLKDGDLGAVGKAFALLGSSKAELKDMVQQVPVAERAMFSEALIAIINDNTGSILQDENDYARLDMIRTAIEDGYYGEGDEWIDNAVSLLDMTGLGMVVGRPVRAVASAVRMNRRMNSVHEQMRFANPSRARASHAAVDGDETGEVSSALAGAPRDEIIADDLLPEIDIGEGAVRNKVNDPDRIVRTERMRNVTEYARQLGSSALRPHEEAKIFSRVITDFEQAEGITARREMFTFSAEGDEFSIRAVYGPSNSGFSRHQDGLDSVKSALRKYGVSDEDITILRRRGDEYEPITIQQAEAESALIDEVVAQRLQDNLGVVPTEEEMFNINQRARMTVDTQPDYLVQVDFKYKGNPLDISDDAAEALEDTVVKRGWFDRLGVGLSNKIGSLTRNLVDPASMFDPDKIVRPMYAGVERSAELETRLVNMARGYTDRMQQFTTDRQNLITEYLHEANRDGIPFNTNNLYAQGFSQDEVRAVSAFREYWDTIWWLENRDLATSLSRTNWGMFVDESSNTQMVVKAVRKERLPGNVEVYNPRTDQLESISRAELDEIYDQGGAVAKLRSPFISNGQYVEHVLTDVGDASGQLRRITADSEVLQYRHGYYPTKYEDPIFIDRVVEDPRNPGRPLETRAVVTAGTTADAENVVRRLQATEAEEGVTYRHRPGREERSADEIAGDDFDLADFGGFTAQRVRGERLRGATANPEIRETAGILSPVDTMLQSARQVSTKVGMRNLIDTYSQRIIRQYEDYLPRNERTGEIEIPSDIREVKYRGVGQSNSKDLGATRSHVEYLKYLQNGYVNHIDDSYKTVMRHLSAIAGEAGNTKLEQTFRFMSQTRGPTALFRGTAFSLYIGTNPMRQWIVQGHQGMQLMANFPASSLKLPFQMPVMAAIATTGTVPKALLKGTGWTKADAMKAYKQWRESGLGAGIDKQNIIRGSLTDLADRTGRRGIPIVSRSTHGLRRLGFDFGETLNRMSAFLVHRDDAIKRGIDVDDPRNLEDLIGASSAYTYGMNRAGDMPYNQNFMGLLLQFMQVPHKAMLSMLTNRSLTRTQRLRLVGFNAMMYTLPPAAMFSLFNDILPAKETTFDVPLIGEVNARDFIVSGLEGAILNKGIEMMTGEETSIDWRGLAPNDQFGMFEMLHSLVTLQPGEVLANTPAGQIFWPDEGSRIGAAFRTVANFTNSSLGNPEAFGTPTKFSDVVRSVASLSSGFSNYFKARMALESQKIVASSGFIGDTDVTRGEAWSTLFGFSTNDAAYNFWLSQEAYEQTQAFEEDVEAWYNMHKRQLTGRDITVDEFEFESSVLSSFWTAFGNDSAKAKEIVDRLIARDVRQQTFGLYGRVLDLYGIRPTSELKGYVRGLPDEDAESREGLLELFDRMDQVGNE